MSCVVKSCKNHRKMLVRKSGVSFHRLPKDQERRQKWLSALGIIAAVPNNAVKYVCSEHFATEDFVPDMSINVLKSKAVPNISRGLLIPSTSKMISPFQFPISTASGSNCAKLTKHRFLSWVLALGRSPMEKLSHSNIVCSKHFTADDFLTVDNRPQLKHNAVPSLHLGPNKPHRNIKISSRFPKNARRALLWAAAIGSTEKNPCKLSNFHICSKHFREDDVYYLNEKRYLKPDAIPVLEELPEPEPEIETVDETLDGSGSDSNSSIIEERKPTVIPFQSLHNKLIQPMGVKLPANVPLASENKPLSSNNSGSNVQNLPKMMNTVSFQNLQKIIQSLGIKTSANVLISTENNSLLKNSQTPNLLHNIIITPISGKPPAKLDSKVLNSKENNIEETIVISDSEGESKQNDAGEPNEVYDSDDNLEDAEEPYNEVEIDEENDKIISEKEYLKTIGLVETFHSYSKGPRSEVPTKQCEALKQKLRTCRTKLKSVMRASARRKQKIVSQRQTILELQKQLSMTTKALQAAHKKLNLNSSHSGRK